MKPKISVIIRTYNSSNFIKKSIQSVLNQTINPQSFEIVVIDDGSTDDTLKVLNSYEDQLKVFPYESNGPINAINIGLDKARGDYFILLDSDDTFIPETLKIFLKVIEDEKVDFVYSDYLELTEKDEIKLVSLKNNIFNSVAGGIVFKKSAVEEVGKYDEQLFFPEYDLLLKLIKKGSTYKHIPKPLFKYYRRDDSLTSNKKAVENGFNQLYEKHGHIANLRRY
ncbi:glycosyltransferase [Methanobacterium sp. BAmetb5]|uniref:glycosyltransferase family 2 protein n=1 Tax=Methanobacterium sp. BAmetb5 TaxID=2025351 RepID=UPI000E98477D|nr:glycosyltransferase [Methanobacterium sp. BAmetb5]AXV38920.1 MAG: hypothetical protein CIT02_00635 [Methanobacterium sp. BAmetb5]